MSTRTSNALELVSKFNTLKKELSETEVELTQQIEELSKELEQVRKALSSFSEPEAEVVEERRSTPRKKARSTGKTASRKTSVKSSTDDTPAVEPAADEPVVEEPVEDSSVEETVVENDVEESPEPVESRDTEPTEDASVSDDDDDFSNLFGDENKMAF